MNSHNLNVSVVLCLLLSLMAACQQQRTCVDNPITVTSDEYHNVFASAFDALRDRHFVVDRYDKRFGIITTHPLIASSIFELWDTRGSTLATQLESTLNYQRRTARITLQPKSSDTNSQITADHPASYLMSVKVILQRLHVPPHQLDTAVVDSTRRSYWRRTASDNQQQFWRTIGRDTDLEQQLILDILHRATTTPEPRIIKLPDNSTSHQGNTH